MKLHKTLWMVLLSLTMGQVWALDEGVDVPECVMQPFDASDGQVDLKALRGKVVYVDFWASWCGPCAKSFPFMNQLHRNLKERGLEVVAVNVDEQLADAEEFLVKQPAEFRIALDSQQACAKTFDVQAMPSTYLVDRKGVIRYVHMGFRATDADNLRSQVEQLLSETP
ncbi:TlpA family protein disulfide reductase [Methylicorpusculum sp.]|uniref:TlpA family protein disulfide reductase n=1 Tax=Methylicorpusculum sp. TaxID=2713644 RepID=UPI00272F4661|nr:TlpA disulfide reductase family protein [Methylicorpusculum sp.]MDP2180386.1 TlpA disulfide reductase family protein [Methylicorpusculum sp.]MDP3527920.1 TlpA disulfide reductase family protein [Methylicorpusculum sp.]MDZ4150845.1 TlpA disulfide reductase family protein [Methylicorpusculum sp.]